MANNTYYKGGSIYFGDAPPDNSGGWSTTRTGSSKNLPLTNLPGNPNQPAQITTLPNNPSQPAQIVNYSSAPASTGSKIAYYTSDIDLQNAQKYLGNDGITYTQWTPGTQIGAGSLALGGSGVIPDSALAGGIRLGGVDRYETAAAMQGYAPTLMRDNIKAALDAQTASKTTLYNQQAEAQAAKIRQAIERQKQQGEATKTDYTNQMNTAIGTLNTERAKIPGQITNLNNQASNTGMINAQKARNALAQMGILQSGESASQQLLNDTTVTNEQNANNLQGQQLDTSYGDKIASAQMDLASKVKQINDSIALAQAQGDENALLVLQDAQAKIDDAMTTNAVNYNNWAYKTGRDAISDRQWQQTFDANQTQSGINNIYRQNQADIANRQWDQNFGLQQGQLLGSYDGQPTLDARQLAASTTRSSAPKAPTAAEINSQRDQLIGQVTSSIYNKVYGKSSTEEAFTELTSKKSSILADLTLAGMSPSEALEFYQQLYDDLSPKKAN